MAAVAQAPRRRFGPFAFLRIVLRIFSMLVLLLACLLPYYLFALLRLCNPWPRAFLAGICWIAGVQIKLVGERPKGSAFLIANHVSWIDIPAIARATGSAFVGHDGLASVPLIKHLCAMNDTVFIARHDRASIHQQVEDVRRAIRETGALTIFPEGTTSDGTGLLPFKSSLLSALEPVPEGVCVIPVLLDYGAEAAGVAWVGDEHGLDNFLRIVARRRPLALTMTFCPPLSGEQVRDRKTMAAAAREALSVSFSSPAP